MISLNISTLKIPALFKSKVEKHAGEHRLGAAVLPAAPVAEDGGGSAGRRRVCWLLRAVPPPKGGGTASVRAAGGWPIPLDEVAFFRWVVVLPTCGLANLSRSVLG